MKNYFLKVCLGRYYTTSSGFAYFAFDSEFVRTVMLLVTLTYPQRRSESNSSSADTPIPVTR